MLKLRFLLEREDGRLEGAMGYDPKTRERERERERGELGGGPSQNALMLEKMLHLCPCLYTCLYI